MKAWLEHGQPWLMKAWPEHGNHGWWKAWPEHGQPWLTEVPFHKPWLTLVDKSLVGAWSTMANWGAISQTMVDHGQWKLGQSITNYALTKLGQSMVNCALEKLSKVPLLTMVKCTMVDHGQPWWPWSNVPWLTMISHGAILQKHGSHGWTMASQPGQVQVPSLIVENRYKVSLLTPNSFVQSGVQWLLKGKFQSLQTCIKMSICVKLIFLYRHIT